MVVSPCISICRTDPVTGYCYGCARNNDEKKTKVKENKETVSKKPKTLAKKKVQAKKVSKK